MDTGKYACWNIEYVISKLKLIISAFKSHVNDWSIREVM